MSTILIKNLIKKIIDANIIKFGQFTLKSGQQSNMYFDFKKIVSYPKILMKISYELSKLINKYDKENTILCGVPMGAIPYATIISTITNIPSIMIRDSTKTYGLQNLIEGEYINNVTDKPKECILIEDVVTTGMSVIETIKKLETNGIMVTQIIVILDRGGLDNIKQLGYNVVSLLKIDNILNYKNNL